MSSSSDIPPTDWGRLLQGIQQRRQALEQEEARARERADRVAHALASLGREASDLNAIRGADGSRVETSVDARQAHLGQPGQLRLQRVRYDDVRKPCVVVDVLVIEVACLESGRVEYYHDDTAIDRPTALDLIGAWVLHHYPDLAPAAAPQQAPAPGKTVIEDEIPF